MRQMTSLVTSSCRDYNRKSERLQRQEASIKKAKKSKIEDEEKRQEKELKKKTIISTVEHQIEN